MKRLFFVSILCLAGIFGMSGLEARDRDDRGCSLRCEHVIRPHDIGSTGFVITKPGVWCLEKSTVYNPITTAPAIRISSSDVVLNFKGRTLSQVNKTVAGIAGVIVDPGVHNVSIRNGTVEGFSLAGIQFNPQNSPTGNQVILVRNMIVNNNGTQGAINGGALGMAGLFTSFGTDILVKNSSFIGNAFQGVIAQDFLKFTMLNCHCDDTVQGALTANAASVSSLGLALVAATKDVSDAFVAHSTFNRNLSDGIARGILIFGQGAGTKARAIKIQNCQMNDNSVFISDPNFAANGQANPRTAGIEMQNFEDVEFRNCEACRNTAGQAAANPTQRALVATGFTAFNGGVAGGSLLIEDCFASGNTTSAVDQPAANRRSIAVGFNIDSPTTAVGPTARVIVRNCVALNNSNPLSFAAGFGVLQISSNNTRIQGDQFVFENCLAENNVGASGKGAGFYLNSTTNSKVLHCVAEKNNIGILVNEDVPGLSSGNIISDNTLAANTDFGIQNATSLSTNAYFSNVAKNNGPTPGSTNYFGDGFPLLGILCPTVCVPANGTPVRFWLLPGPPCALNSNCTAGDKLDNISIVN